MNSTPAEKERRLAEGAERALKEAEVRRAATREDPRPVELGGRDGPEATRYGDWEKSGIAIDF
jgi:hypothetical protein